MYRICSGVPIHGLIRKHNFRFYHFVLWYHLILREREGEREGETDRQRNRDRDRDRDRDRESYFVVVIWNCSRF